MKPLQILLVKETCNGKSDEYFVKLQLCRYPKSSTSDLYEFKMSLFDHGKPEDFLLFIRNFNTNLAATGMLNMDTKIQYLCTLFLAEVLHKFCLLFADVENTETLNVDYYTKGLAKYFSM